MKSSISLTGSDMDQAWLGVICACHDYGHNVGPRGLMTSELLVANTQVSMSQPTLGVIRRKINYRHLANEALWILTGSNQLSMISEYAPIYSKFSDDGIVLQGAYGPPVTEQLRYVVDTLNSDPESRQAVISIWRPNPRPSKDIPCTLSLQFLIRNHKLHCIATMRSSDAWLGLPYDVFCFTMIAASVALRLTMDVELGVLAVRSGSLHLYHKDSENARECVRSMAIRQFEPMSLQGLDTPDDLLNDLRAILNAYQCKNAHLNSISSYIKEMEIAK